MRIALLADIHANLTALQTVLDDAVRRGVDGGAWVAGDTVGYGPDPDECIRAVADLGAIAVAGNHDLAACGRISTEDFNPLAATAMEWTVRQLSADSKTWLSALPLKVAKPPFTLVHGSPRDPIWEYLLTVEAAEENLHYFDTPGCVVGHSHLQFVFHVSEAGAEPQPVVLDKPVILDPESRFYINPGSVGQSRDGDPRAGYAVLDWDAGEVEFHRVPYDIAATQARMRRARLPEPLITRLSVGR